MTTTQATQVRYRWDSTDSRNEGWYVLVEDEDGRALDDSEKIRFPVDVDEFSRDQEDELVAELRDAFPGVPVKEA